MYASITDPVTGNRLYADLTFQDTVTVASSGAMSTELNCVFVKDVVTEEEIIESVINQLRGVVVRDIEMLKNILHSAFNVSIDTCPELVGVVSARLNGNVFVEGGI